VRHLTSASASGRAALAEGMSADELHAAAVLDANDEPRVIRAGAEASAG
jgi:2-phosphosulfolactate phosphatase